MSTVANSMTCPQCAGEAGHTFDCRDSSSTIGCYDCGYTEYHGPEYGPGFMPTGRWIDRKDAGYGVIRIKSSEALGMVTILRCSTEEEFTEALAAVFDQTGPSCLWAEAVRWNSDTQTSEPVRSYPENRNVS